MSENLVDPDLPASKKRGSRVREETEQRILRAATEVFAARGFAAATIAEMVEASGLARGTFYLYFNDKRAVFYALVARVTEDLYDIVTPPGAAATYRERLHRATTAYVEVFTRHAGVIKCIFEVATCDMEINKLQNGYRERFRQRIEAHFERNVRLGTFRNIDPKTASYCLCAMVEGSAYEWACANFKPWNDSRQGVKRLVDTLTDIWCHYVQLPSDQLDEIRS
jgi:AcrR family transcriptional regulator